MDQQSSRRPRSPSPPHESSKMRRSQDYLNGSGELSSQTRRYSSSHGCGESSRPKSASYPGNSLQNTTPSESLHAPRRSLMEAPQPMPPIILPSPLSFNFPSSQSLPSMSPPARSQIPTQSAELQDLQHQVSLRTSELRTLQREHDALLQKFERQKGKCAMMEKKLEFSDVEMDSLRDVKEKLSVQVSTMECQIEDLQQSRDEARRQLVANGAQYMQIMEMANRLQTQSTEAKRKWETEKAGLEQRIRVLEEAMVTGTERPIPTSNAEQQPGITPVSSPIGFTHNVSTSQAETISVLRTEVGRLRSRTQTLEAAMQTMRSESLAIQTAARQIVESSGKLSDTAQDVVDEDA